MTYIIWHVHTISIHPPTLLTLDVGLKTNEITLPGGWIRLLATLPLLFSLGIPCYKHLHKLTSTKSCIHYWANAATNNILVSRHIIERTLKGLSHWRRRRRDCRDWSVAAIRATRETKKWLALSPRRRRRDCWDWSVTATRETKLWLALSRRGDVSETCWRLKKSPKKIEHVWISRDSPETRLVSRRRRGDVSATSGDSSRHLVSKPVR